MTAPTEGHDIRIVTRAPDASTPTSRIYVQEEAARKFLKWSKERGWKVVSVERRKVGPWEKWKP